MRKLGNRDLWLIRRPYGILNQQNLYLIPPTTLALLLLYSGSRIVHKDGFSSCKRLTVRLN